MNPFLFSFPTTIFQPVGLGLNIPSFNFAYTSHAFI
mgnify:CR=1 FL=1